MSKFYDWNTIRTYGADVTMVVGARGIGKTYGLRLCFMSDWAKRRTRFVQIARYRESRRIMEASYFDRISELPQWKNSMFKIASHVAYVAAKPVEGQKPDWQTCGYFVCMTQQQDIKNGTFAHVGNICLDEAVLDKRDQYRRYLTNEVAILARIVDSVTRERPDSETHPHVYLLGNALDPLNPYFERYRIMEPEYGKSWHDDHNMLLDYVEPGEYSQKKATDTVAGRILAGLPEGQEDVMNKFTDEAPLSMIGRKPAKAVPEWNVMFRGLAFSIWGDYSTGTVWIVDRTVKDVTTLAITLDDFGGINMLAAKRAEGVIKTYNAIFFNGGMRFANQTAYRSYRRVAEFYGVR